MSYEFFAVVELVETMSDEWLESCAIDALLSPFTQINLGAIDALVVE